MDSWFENHFINAARIIQGFLAEHMALAGARILDFGCGDGITALGLAQAGPGLVVGADIHPSFLHLPKLAAANCDCGGLPPHLAFVQIAPDYQLPFADHAFDAAYSWSVFEHLGDVPAALAALRRVVRPGGFCLIQIDPLYHSPFGSHLRRLVDEPWGHLLASTTAFLNRVEAAEDLANETDKGDLLYRENDFAGVKKHLIGQFLDLNRLTVRQLLYFARASGFTVVRALPVSAPRELVPPPQLACSFPADDLLTCTIYLVLRN